MINYYVQLLHRKWDNIEWFLEEGMLDDLGEYLVYRELSGYTLEVYKNMNDFKKNMVHKYETDFDKYCVLTELK